jgi:hypothetical protein
MIIELRTGTLIEHAVDILMEAAMENNCIVSADFNGYILEAFPWSSGKGILEAYERVINLARKEHMARLEAAIAAHEESREPGLPPTEQPLS